MNDPQQGSQPDMLQGQQEPPSGDGTAISGTTLSGWQPATLPGDRKPAWRKRMMIVLTILSILGLAGTGYAYFDWFKSPLQIYAEAELQTLSDMGSEASRIARSATEWAASGTVREKRNASLTFEGLDRVSEDVLPVYELLGQLRWNQDVQSDESGMFYGTYRLSHEESDWLHLEAASDTKRNGFRVMPFYEPWLVYDNNPQKQENNSVLSRKLYSTEEWRQALQPSMNELLPLITRYIGWFQANLDSSQFNLESGVPLKAGSESFTLRKLTIAFTDEQLKSFVGGFVHQVANDPELLELLHTKLTIANEMASDTWGERPFEIPALSQWKLDVKVFDEEFNSGLNAMNFKDIYMEIWIDRNDHIVKRNWNIGLQQNDGDNWDTVTYSSLSDRPADPLWTDTFFKMTDGNQILLQTTLANRVTSVSGGKRNTNWKWNQILNIPDEEPLQFAVDLQSESDASENGQTVKSDVNIAFGSESMENTLRGKWVSDAKRTDAGQLDRNWELVWDVEASQTEANSGNVFPQKVHFKMNAAAQPLRSIALPEWSAENSKDITTLTPETEEEIIAGFQDGFSNWLGEHFIELSVFFSLLGE